MTFTPENTRKNMTFFNTKLSNNSKHLINAYYELGALQTSFDLILIITL